MTDTWLPWCIKRPGPLSKLGYSGVSWRPLSQIEGEVKHSTEGTLLGAFGELDKLTRQASWHFTIDYDGTTYQHYPLEAICWHCGVMGDRGLDTSLIGNLTLIGVEHVDRDDSGQYATLRQPQIEATAHLTRDIRSLCSVVGNSPPTLRRNLWEHNWLSSTACPSGLIPWAQVISLLEDIDMPDPIIRAEDGRMGQLGVAGLHHHGDIAVLNALKEGGAKVVPVTNDLYNKLLGAYHANVREVTGGYVTKEKYDALVTQLTSISQRLTNLEQQGIQVDNAAIAKAVNDEAAERMKQ